MSSEVGDYDIIVAAINFMTNNIMHKRLLLYFELMEVLLMIRATRTIYPAPHFVGDSKGKARGSIVIYYSHWTSHS